jgi:PhnB protein
MNLREFCYSVLSVQVLVWRNAADQSHPCSSQGKFDTLSGTSQGVRTFNILEGVAMELIPYLNFNGQCEEAFKFYERLLAGKITFLMTHEGAPMADPVRADWLKKIMHASLSVGDQLLQGADVPPGHYQKPQGFSVSINIKDASEAERIFHALAENGTVQMAIAEAFWAIRFGMVTDRFGIPWMINCGKPI